MLAHFVQLGNWPRRRRLQGLACMINYIPAPHCGQLGSLADLGGCGPESSATHYCHIDTNLPAIVLPATNALAKKDDGSSPHG